VKIFCFILIIFIPAKVLSGQPEQAALNEFVKIILPEHYKKDVIVQYDGRISSPESKYQEYAPHLKIMYGMLRDTDFCTCLLESDPVENDGDDKITTNSSIEPQSFDSVNNEDILLDVPKGIRKKKKLRLKEINYRFYRITKPIRRIKGMISRTKYNLYMFPLVYYDNHYYVELDIIQKCDDDNITNYWIEFTKNMKISKWCYYIPT
jgi:hypothetical protein